MNERDDRRARSRDEGPRPEVPRSDDYRQAMERLERAVSALEGSARERLSDRATRALDGVADRLEREAQRRGRHRRRHRHRRHYWGCHRGGSHGYDPADAPEEPGDGAALSGRRRLRLDPRRARIGGVCAGVARYHGMEPWVVRCIAVTAALFFPSIVIPAYLIAWVVLDSPARSRRREARRAEAAATPVHDAAPAPELGAWLSPRRSLRDLQGNLGEVEQRLRRMERHVTSGQYELQRELNKIARSV